MYDLETEKVINKIKEVLKIKENPKIVVQAPEGIKNLVVNEIEKIKKLLNVDIFLYIGSCFGACDIPKIDYDLLVHYGHEPLSYIKYKNVLFIPAFRKFNEEEKKRIIKDIEEYTKDKDVEIATTIQYKKLLETFNPKIILGCRANLEDREEILFVGNGRFHPLILSYKYKKDITIYNPEIKKFDKIGKEESYKFIKRRLTAISKLFFNKPKKVGVILIDKVGQRRIKVFNSIINELKKNKIGYIKMIVDTLTPELLYYDVDCYIVVGCPRIVLDDYIRYNKPIYTPKEFLMYLNNNLEKYILDEITEKDF
ncbi:diphthamide biosynthesis enzyme Dph2 [Methanocaldococcus indicus]|uniref:diphthamide biosynthesis enzyme Dph2 n=1 Tax=Methanocaldococcus indicus TaxID=213231 RepID=UPI003C6DADFB